MRTESLRDGDIYPRLSILVDFLHPQCKVMPGSDHPILKMACRVKHLSGPESECPINPVTTMGSDRRIIKISRQRQRHPR